MVLEKKNDIYVIKLGTMGEQANSQIIYKPTWFYTHLPSLEHRILRNDLLCEFNPAHHQGRNTEQLQRIREDNQCAIIRALGTRLDPKTDETMIVGHVVPTGPHFSTLEQMLSVDPQAESWGFRLRCLTQAIGEDGRKRLVPPVERVITWDLFTF